MATLELPRNVSQDGHAPSDCFAVVLDDVMTREECAALVAKVGDPSKLQKVKEASGDGGAKIAIQQPRTYSLGVFKDEVLSDGLWRRLAERCGPSLEAFFGDKRGEAAPAPLGLNSRLRVLRYAPGERFEAHYDAVVDDGHQRSLVTVLVYLTDACWAGLEPGGLMCFPWICECSLKEMTSVTSRSIGGHGALEER